MAKVRDRLRPWPEHGPAVGTMGAVTDMASTPGPTHRAAPGRTTRSAALLHRGSRWSPVASTRRCGRSAPSAACSRSRSGSAPPSTSRSTPATAALSPPHRREHPQPRRRAVDRLRHPRLHHPGQGARAAHRRPVAAVRRHHHGRARAADRDHHRRRGHPGRARQPPRGRASASARPAGRSCATTCCPTRCPASSPAPCCRWPGRSARRRR